MTKLLVLAGGFGTRLRDTVADVPKPLAPVAGKPYLHHLLKNLVSQGVNEFVFSLFHQSKLIEEFLITERELGVLRGCQVDTLVEPSPLGTGGAIAYAVQRGVVRDNFLVTNADTWLGAGQAEVLGSPAPTIATVRVADAGRYGTVECADGKVISFLEKQPGAGKINAGLYHLSSELFKDWDGLPFSLERDLFPKLALQGRLNSVSLDTEFIDIGVPEDYFQFCRWIESKSGGTP